MKKYGIFITIIMMIVFVGCDDFLDTNDYLNKNDQNFPATEADAEMSLASLYQTFTSNQEYSVHFTGDVTSDDRFSGGGPDDRTKHGWDQMKKEGENMFESTWSTLFKGVFRSNKLIEAIDRIDFTSESNKNTVLGEAYFMRALFYFELSRIFGEVPLLPTSEAVNIPKSPARDTYAQIASDLQKAIDLIPAVKYAEMPKSRLGHATKWAAEALLARVYLFYTGYYNATELPLTGGGALSKNQIVAYLDDCINNSGHGLVESDFRNMWPYTNELTREDYPYTKGKNLAWVGDDNNHESIFALKFGTKADWNHVHYSNWVALSCSFRGQNDYANVFPFGYGWGQGTVNPKMVEQWIADEPADTIRRWGSVIDVHHEREGLAYEENGWTMVLDGGYASKKYISVTAWSNKEDRKVASYSYLMFGGASDDLTFGCTQDQVLIRFADVLLMHSELTETVTGINLVRNRATLPSISAYSLEVLQKERRYELAFEGLRYYDLLRWYREEAGMIIDQNQNGANVLSYNTPNTVQYELGKRIRETGGFYQIPLSEIELSDGVLTQNKGWDMSGINIVPL